MSAMTGDSGPLRDREEKQMDISDQVRHAQEVSDRTARVEAVMEELTRPIFVWRMAKGKVLGKGRLARGAQTTYFRVVEEIDEILKRHYGSGNGRIE